MASEKRVVWQIKNTPESLRRFVKAQAELEGKQPWEIVKVAIDTYLKAVDGVRVVTNGHVVKSKHEF